MKTMMAVMLATVTVVGTAGSASAVKPARGCPDNYTLFTSSQIFEMFPTVTSEMFNKYDKNADGLICGKQLPSIFNPIDNTANRP